MEIEAKEEFGLEMTVSQIIKDYPKALKRLEIGAQNGSTDAVKTLFSAHNEGIGVEPNLEKAIFWHRILEIVDQETAGRAPADPENTTLRATRTKIRSATTIWLDQNVRNFKQ